MGTLLLPLVHNTWWRQQVEKFVYFFYASKTMEYLRPMTYLYSKGLEQIVYFEELVVLVIEMVSILPPEFLRSKKCGKILRKGDKHDTEGCMNINKDHI